MKRLITALLAFALAASAQASDWDMHELMCLPEAGGSIDEEGFRLRFPKSAKFSDEHPSGMSIWTVRYKEEYVDVYSMWWHRPESERIEREASFKVIRARVNRYTLEAQIDVNYHYPDFKELSFDKLMRCVLMGRVL